MTKQEFSILAMSLKATYTSERFLPDDNSLLVWYTFLKDIEYPLLSLAIQKYIMTHKYPPTIADIRQTVAEVTQPDIDPWDVAWAKVMKVVEQCGMTGRDEAMTRLGDTVTRTVVKRIGYGKLCASDNLSVDRANFRDMYNQEVQRRKEASMMSPQLRTQIASTQQRNQAQIIDGGVTHFEGTKNQNRLEKKADPENINSKITQLSKRLRLQTRGKEKP